MLKATQQGTKLGKLVRKLMSSSGKTIQLALAATRAKKPLNITKTPEEALTFLLLNDQTKNQYSEMKMSNDESGAKNLA